MLTALPRLKARGLDRLRDGDVVLADASEDTVGISKLVELTNVGVTEVVSGQHTIAIRFDPAVAVNGFKGYLQFCPPFAQHLRRLAAGTKVYAINRQHVASIEMPLPPVEEQRSIATALTDVDALLDGLDRLIAKKRDLKQAAMQQLLTGRTRLPGFADEWDPKPLRHAGRCLRGVTYAGGSDLSPRDTPLTTRLLRANNVQDATVNTTDVQFVNSNRVASPQLMRRNDILICMANGSKALVGKAGVFSIEDGFAYTFGAFMGCFRTEPSLADPGFVFYLFNTATYRNYINLLLAGSSINNLRPSSIGSLEFHYPTQREQVAIAEVLGDMSAEIAALEARRDKTRLLKQAMMQELLTGRTRLVDTQGATA